MALIKYDAGSLVSALKPGLTALVTNEFRWLFEEKINGIIKEITDELKDELPSKIEAAISHVFDEKTYSQKINVTVDLRGFGEDK